MKPLRQQTNGGYFVTSKKRKSRSQERSLEDEVEKAKDKVNINSQRIYYLKGGSSESCLKAYL